MAKKVKVINTETDQVLFETSIEEIQHAYEYAAKMDEMGINVKLLSPTISETLSESLGLSADDRDKLNESIHDEIHDHEGSCCAGPHEFDNEDKIQ